MNITCAVFLQNKLLKILAISSHSELIVSAYPSKRSPPLRSTILTIEEFIFPLLYTARLREVRRSAPPPRFLGLVVLVIGCAIRFLLGEATEKSAGPDSSTDHSVEMKGKLGGLPAVLGVSDAEGSAVGPSLILTSGGAEKGNPRSGEEGSQSRSD